MSDPGLQVDVEEVLVHRVLRVSSDVLNLLGGELRVYSPARPSGATYPLLTVQRIIGTQQIGEVLWLDSALVQLDAWAQTRKAAWRLAATAEAVLYDAPGSYEAGVITKVVEEGGLQPLQDPDTNDLYHVVLQMRVYAHPHDTFLAS